MLISETEPRRGYSVLSMVASVLGTVVVVRQSRNPLSREPCFVVGGSLTICGFHAGS
jgi:hypothetical protein